jgi:hypothetical protein
MSSVDELDYVLEKLCDTLGGLVIERHPAIDKGSQEVVVDFDWR